MPGLSYSSSAEVPGLVRPVSTAVPLQFNNNNSVHVVNTSLPVYSPPSTYGLNLSSKTTEAKVENCNEPGKTGHDDDTLTLRNNPSDSSRHRLAALNQFYDAIKSVSSLRHCPLSTGSEGNQNVPSKLATFPLNLCVESAEDKKVKRTVETGNLESDRGKRVKCEQTEATDLSMKSSCGASQPRPSNQQVRVNIYFIK